MEKFVERNVVEVDALIAKARERLEEVEKEAAGKDDEVVNKMRHGIARLQVYRSFIEKMN